MNTNVNEQYDFCSLDMDEYFRQRFRDLGCLGVTVNIDDNKADDDPIYAVYLELADYLRNEYEFSPLIIQISKTKVENSIMPGVGVSSGMISSGAPIIAANKPLIFIPAGHYVNKKKTMEWSMKMSVVDDKLQHCLVGFELDTTIIEVRSYLRQTRSSSAELSMQSDRFDLNDPASIESICQNLRSKCAMMLSRARLVRD